MSSFSLQQKIDIVELCSQLKDLPGASSVD